MYEVHEVPASCSGQHLVKIMLVDTHDGMAGFKELHCTPPASLM
jgi:hypothetical protein